MQKAEPLRCPYISFACNSDSLDNPGGLPSFGLCSASSLSDLLVSMGIFASRPCLAPVRTTSNFDELRSSLDSWVGISCLFVLIIGFIRSTTTWVIVLASSIVRCLTNKVGLLCHGTHVGFTRLSAFASHRIFFQCTNCDFYSGRLVTHRHCRCWITWLVIAG